jgi:hypothetical protein
MNQLSQEQLLALGGLTVAFSIVDEAVSFAIERLSLTTNERIIAALIEQMTFGVRVQRLNQIFKIHLADPEIAETLRGAVDGDPEPTVHFLDLIDEAGKVSTFRNGIIHCRFRLSEPGKLAYLADKSGVELDATPSRIDEVSEQAIHIGYSMTFLAAIFQHVLEQLLDGLSARAERHQK